MESQKQYVTITDGTYILSETDLKNEFLFYRKDGGVLGNVGRIPMDMYEWRMYQNAVYYNINEPIIESIIFERSRDDTVLMMTIMWYEMSEEKEEEVINKAGRGSRIYEFIKKYFC